jgi:hypothetical protein
MKKTVLLIIGVLVAAVAVSQTKLTPVKKNGKYIAPIVFPLTSEVEIDSTNFWKPKPTTPTDDTTKIDARNATYAGAWYNDFTRNSSGQIANVGWYKNTIALSNTAGNTASFRFQGTKVELWGERKTTHGTGVVTLRSGTTIVETKNVTFIGPTQLPSLIYTNTAALQLGTVYTLELKVTTGYNLLDFFVVKDYTQVLGGTDPPVEPPVPSNRINVSPNQNVKGIIETASNTEIFFLPGNYNLAYTKLPPTVSLNSAAGTSNITGTQRSSTQDSQGIFMINGGTDQYIKNLNIYGNRVSGSGIVVQNATRFTIEHVNVKLCTFTGIWAMNCTDFKLKDFSIDNSSWSSVGWCSGELSMGGKMIRPVIGPGKIHNNENIRGYGIKALWGSGEWVDPTFVGLEVQVSPTSLWNNGQSLNISFEIHNTWITGLMESYDCIWHNQLSMALHTENTGTLYFHESVINTHGGTYAFENVCNNLFGEDLSIWETQMLSANFKDNMVTKNTRFNRVNFRTPAGPPGWGGINYIGEKGTQNYNITNSLIEMRAGEMTRYRGVRGGVSVDASNTVKVI